MKLQTPSHGPYAQRLRLERLTSVTVRTGLSRTTIWRFVKEGYFPAPVRIGGKSVAWPSIEVDEWIAARIAERNDG